MADYYEEDFSTEYRDEDVMSDMFGGEEEYDEEGEAFARNFESMTPEERESRYGNKDFFDLLNEMDAILYNSHRFFVRNLRIVSATEFSSIIDELNERTPSEIRKGRDIISREQSIISNAEDQAAAVKSDADSYDAATRTDADQYYADIKQQGDDYYSVRVQEGNDEKAIIIENARRTAEQMVSEHQITLDAKAEGDRIIAEANKTAQDFVADVNQKCADYKASVNRWCDDSMKKTAEYCYKLLVAARAVATDNIGKFSMKTF